MSLIAETLTLRPYQEEALRDLLAAIKEGSDPVCAMATGSGKSIVIAALCAELGTRVLVATHRKELLEQNSETLQRFLPGTDYGIYSAGLEQRETDSRVIFGGVQSIYRRMEELQRAGEFGAVICDESHRCPPPSRDSMYKTVFEACPNATRIGFSATPYRMDNGPIYGDADSWFTFLSSHIGVETLTEMGYLSPLVGLLTAADVPLDGVRKQAGEFVLSDLSQSASEESVAKQAVDELCRLAANRKSWLVFCVDVAHTELITGLLCDKGIHAKMIVGSTPSEERAETLEAFRAGGLRALVNCQVGTEGFDIPRVDCVAMFRPTMSKSLAVQMIGRGTRLFPEKDNCLVLDMAGNLERHVPLDGIPQYLRSPERAKQEERKEAAERIERERMARHGAHASTLDPRYAQAVPPRMLKVLTVKVRLSPSKKRKECTNLRVQYLCMDEHGQKVWVNDWLCPEYTGWPRKQAQAWFSRRGLPMPPHAEAAIGVANAAPQPHAILCAREGGWDRIKMEYFE